VSVKEHSHTAQTQVLFVPHRQEQLGQRHTWTGPTKPAKNKSEFIIKFDENVDGDVRYIRNNFEQNMLYFS
jgi:hypothetical protein